MIKNAQLRMCSVFVGDDLPEVGTVFDDFGVAPWEGCVISVDTSISAKRCGGFVIVGSRVYLYFSGGFSSEGLVRLNSAMDNILLHLKHSCGDRVAVSKAKSAQASLRHFVEAAARATSRETRRTSGTVDVVWPLCVEVIDLWLFR